MTDNWWENDAVVSGSPTSNDKWWEADDLAEKGKKASEHSLLKALAYGIADTARGDANTARKLGTGGEIPQALADTVTSMAGLQGYEPAGATTWNSEKPFLDRLMASPYAIAESLPGYAQDIAASAAGTFAAGPAGGLAAFGASHGGRTAGDTVDRVRATDGTDPNADLSTSQKARVGAAVLADTVLSRIGVNATVGKGVIKEVGSKAIKELAKDTLKAGAVDAASAVGGITADKAIVEGKLPNPSDLAVGAIVSGTGGLAGRAIHNAMGEAPTAYKYRGLNELPQPNVIEVAKGLQKAKARGAGEDVYGSTGKEFDTHIANYANRAKQQIKDTDVGDQLTLARKALTRGETIDPDHWNTLKDNLGGAFEGDELLNALKNRDTLNQMGPYFDGLKPKVSTTDRIAGTMDRHLAWSALTGGKFHGAAAAFSAAKHAIPHALAKITGADDPASVIINKFADRTSSAQGTPSDPYVSPVLAAQAQAKVDAKAAAELKKQNAVLAKQKAAADKKTAADTAKREKKMQGMQDRAIKGIEKSVDTLSKDFGFLENSRLNGAYSEIDPKDLAFRAQLEQQAMRKSGKSIDWTGVPNIEDPSAPLTWDKVAPNDSIRKHLFTKIGQGEETESQRMRREYEAELAARENGIDLRRIPVKGAEQFLRQDNFDTSSYFPEPKRLVANMPEPIERPPSSHNLAKIDALTAFGKTVPDRSMMFSEPKVLTQRMERRPPEQPPFREPYVNPMDAKIAQASAWKQALAEDAARPPVDPVAPKPVDRLKTLMEGSVDFAPEEAPAPKAKKSSKSAMAEAIAQETPTATEPRTETRTFGRKDTKFTVSEDKLRSRKEDGSPDFDAFFRGVEGKVHAREAFIDSLKGMVGERHHPKLDLLESEFLKSGMNKPLAEQKFEAFLAKTKLAPSGQESLRKAFKKFNTKKQWND